MAAQAAREDSEPLNLSQATRILRKSFIAEKGTKTGTPSTP
jgi:hypothetical protein